jgi:hypothetical protein
MSKFTYESQLSECKTELTYNSYFENEPCVNKQIEGTLAKRRIALQLILLDICECNDALNLISQNINANHCSFVYKSFVVTYGKCFASAATRGLSLQAKDIFKQQPELLSQHHCLIKTRNKYIAHSDSEVFESSEVYLVESASEHEFFVPTLKFGFPTGNSIKQGLDLVLYVYEQVKNQIKKVESKLAAQYA